MSLTEFRGLALRCDFCGEEHVDLTEVPGFVSVDANGGVAEVLVVLAGLAEADGWRVGASGVVGCPDHAADVPWIDRKGHQHGEPLPGLVA